MSDSVLYICRRCMNECTIIINKIYYWNASFDFTKNMYDVENCMNDANSMTTCFITQLLWDTII